MPKKSSKRMPQKRRKGYYDPAAKPYPRTVELVPGDPGPIGNSRNQRRQRAKLSFEDQRALAASVGFEVGKTTLPTSWTSAKIAAAKERWILYWEEQYAKR